MNVFWTAALASFLTALALTPLARALGRRARVLDVPNARSSHAVPTPRTGGVAIALASAGGLAWGGVLNDSGFALAFAGIAMMFVAGLADDVVQVRPIVRLTIQLAAAALVVAGGTVIVFRVGSVPAAAATAITLFWLVAATNAFNFMDGINGIAASTAVIIGATYAALALREGDVVAATIAAVVAAAAAGFLGWNLTGSVFMGDGGSAFLGFALATIGLRLTTRDVSPVAAVLPWVPFLADTGVTLVRRALRRERIYEAHRTHYYQKLTGRGWTHALVMIVWCTLALLCSSVALGWERMAEPLRTGAVVVVVLVHVVTFVAIDLSSASRAGKS